MPDSKKVLYKNAKIYQGTSDGKEGCRLIVGELETTGNKITYCGPERRKETGEDKDVPVYDLKGNLILPGFKNVHTHSAMTFLRSYADDLPLDRWLNEQVFPMEAKLTGEDIYWLTKLAIMEYLTSGITCGFDMYYEPADIALACKESGFRMALCGAVNNFKESAQLLADYYETYNHYDPLISYHLGAHAEYTMSEALLKEIAGLVQHYKAPFYIHNSETQSEVEGCIERHGMTPVQYLTTLGLYDYGGAGFHMVYTNEEDRRIMKEKGIGVVTNPASNLKLASGIAPIAEYLKAGIPVAIGTDGPASNNCLDMFREMYLVTALAKVVNKDAACVPAEEVLSMACENGARMIGQNHMDGILEGKTADFVVIDLAQPNMQPQNHIIKNVIYSGSKQNVIMTVIDGVVKYDHGRFYIGEEPETIYRKANEIIRGME